VKTGATEHHRKINVTDFRPDAPIEDPHRSEIEIGHQKVGDGHPVYVVAEVGINHNGSLKNALALIDIAAAAGCDAVKFQKRSPDHCVPAVHRSVNRDTPWGTMTYLEYRHRIELGSQDYDIINSHCQKRGLAWFASCWDKSSVDFIKSYGPDCYKIASACLTDDEILTYTRSQGKPVILSTGMSTMGEIRKAVSHFDPKNLLIVHTTSNYTGKAEELNLSMIHTLKNEFGGVIGYSGHEDGIAPTIAAVAMGACYVERHITLDRCMWGSDQAISLEPDALVRLVKDIRLVEKAIGDGIKRVYDSEKTTLAKLRTCR
jgi:N-acetylneuraminate synthase